MDKKIAHLTFIQGVISRMAQNSFLIKGWSITLIAALFALAAQGSNKSFVLIAYFPCLMFWLLDTFFLYQEKLYRLLYDQVASNKITSDKFTLNTSEIENDSVTFFTVFFSKTLLPFYGLILCSIILIMFGNIF